MYKDKKYWNLKLIFGLVLLVFGITLNYFSANYIHYRYAGYIDRNPDILLDNYSMPWVLMANLTEVLLIFSLLYFVYVNRANYMALVDALLLFGIFTVLRGVFLPLTIMGGITSQSLFSNLMIFNTGLFPSGHTALSLVLLFKTSYHKWFFALSSVLVVTGLILAQQHYTIDIFSSVIFVYAIKSFMEKHV